VIARAALLISALALGTGAHYAGEEARRARNAHANPEELIYLPEGRILRMASLGQRNLLADLVWLRAIQYYGEHRLTDRNYDQAERLFDVIFELDPAFTGAIRFGALVLAQDAANPEGAIALLRRAAGAEPTQWEYPFDEGFICQTVLKDYERAGMAYRKASMLPGAPDLAARLAGLSFSKLTRRDVAREVWQSILADGSSNEMMKRIAERSLKTLSMEETEEVLTKSVEMFREKEGRDPVNWDELLKEKCISSLPEEPFGGRYFLDARTGRVRATTHVDREMGRVREILSGAIAQYRGRHGQNPPSFAALLEEGMIDALPEEPFGVALAYDARRGAVTWSPPWPETEPGYHGAH
jgi:tetratricopeptide (TPR) repeat protein